MEFFNPSFGKTFMILSRKDFEKTEISYGEYLNLKCFRGYWRFCQQRRYWRTEIFFTKMWRITSIFHAEILHKRNINRNDWKISTTLPQRHWVTRSFPKKMYSKLSCRDPHWQKLFMQRFTNNLPAEIPILHTYFKESFPHRFPVTEKSPITTCRNLSGRGSI